MNCVLIIKNLITQPFCVSRRVVCYWSICSAVLPSALCCLSDGWRTVYQRTGKSYPLQQIAVLGFQFCVMFVHSLSFSISAVFLSLKECIHIKNMESIGEEIRRPWKCLDDRSTGGSAQRKAVSNVVSSGQL
jgi:hypothetical protein